MNDYERCRSCKFFRLDRATEARDVMYQHGTCIRYPPIMRNGIRGHNTNDCHSHFVQPIVKATGLCGEHQR